MQEMSGDISEEIFGHNLDEPDEVALTYCDHFGSKSKPKSKSALSTKGIRMTYMSDSIVIHFNDTNFNQNFIFKKKFKIFHNVSNDLQNFQKSKTFAKRVCRSAKVPNQVWD